MNKDQIVTLRNPLSRNIVYKYCHGEKKIERLLAYLLLTSVNLTTFYKAIGRLRLSCTLRQILLVKNCNQCLYQYVFSKQVVFTTENPLCFEKARIHINQGTIFCSVQHERHYVEWASAGTAIRCARRTTTYCAGWTLIIIF